MAVKVFMRLAIETAAYEKAQAAYEEGVALYASVGAQYGLDPAVPLSKRDPESLEILSEAAAHHTEKAYTFVPPLPNSAQLELTLDDTACPKAVSNFVGLVKGDNKKGLSYLGSSFHRIVKGFVCQGGDVTRGDGSGGESIWGGTFNDDKKGLEKAMDRAGLVCMANSGRKNTNTSQFFFTLAACPAALKGKHVVLGEVTNREGLDFLERLDREVASADGRPLCSVTVTECGCS